VTVGVRVWTLALALTSCGTATVTPTPAVASIATMTATTALSAPPALARQLTGADAQQALGAVVRDVLSALKRRDGTAIAGAAHQTKGVRFSQDAHVRPATDITLTAAQLTNAFADPTKRRWGATSGRGDPIVLTFAEFHNAYIYARDFAASSRTAYNRTIGFGNSTDNTADIYPDAVLFEAFDPGPDPRLAEFQWQCLRLLFEREAGRWSLVAVVHGEWTI
jgi:hypothetical protein